MIPLVIKRLEPDLLKIYNKLIEDGWNCVSNSRMIFMKDLYEDFHTKVTVIKGRRKFRCQVDWDFSKLLWIENDSRVRLIEFHKSDKTKWFRSRGQLENREISVDQFGNLDEILDEMFDNIQNIHSINKVKRLRLFNENI